MMMRSLRNSRRKSATPFFIGLAILAIFAFVARGTIFSLGSTAAIPLWQSSMGQNLVAAAGSLFTSRESLENELARLRTELEAANYRALDVRLAAAENTARQPVHAEQKVMSGIDAKVLTRPNRSIYDTLVVASGEADGVAVGDVALAAESIAIGTVTSVAAHTSVVTLYSSPGKTTDVILQTENIVVIAEGQGGGGFIAKVPQDVPVTAGDIVALPHAKTIAFAVVDQVVVVPADPFKKVYFQNPVNMYTLPSVTLVKP